MRNTYSQRSSIGTGSMIGKYFISPDHYTICEIIDEMPETQSYGYYVKCKIINPTKVQHRGVIGRNKEYLKICKFISKEQNPEYFL